MDNEARPDPRMSAAQQIRWLQGRSISMDLYHSVYWASPEARQYALTRVRSVSVLGAVSPEPIGVTIDEAAEMLRVSRKTIEGMIDREELTIFTIGTNNETGRLRVDYASLKALPALKRVDPATRDPRRSTKG